MIKIREKKIGIMIEVKSPDDGNLENACKAALKQMEIQKYETKLKQSGMTEIHRYGVAFYKKQCQVMLGGKR